MGNQIVEDQNKSEYSVIRDFRNEVFFCETELRYHSLCRNLFQWKLRWKLTFNFVLIGHVRINLALFVGSIWTIFTLKMFDSSLIQKMPSDIFGCFHNFWIKLRTWSFLESEMILRRRIQMKVVKYQCSFQ